MSGSGAREDAVNRSFAWCDLRDLDFLARVGTLGADGALREPLLLLRLDEPGQPADVAAAASAMADAHGVVVGVVSRGALHPSLRPLVSELDLTLVPSGAAVARDQVAVQDPISAASQLRTQVEANPQASTVLAGLLRWSGSLRVSDALDAESLAYSALLGGREFQQWLDRRGHLALPSPATEPVIVVREGDQLRITLNRSERRNAYGREVRDALVAALEVADLDPTVTCVRLDGAGPVFSAGGDLAEFGTAPDLTTAHLVRTRAGAGRLLHRLADRLEVHVHGSCVGAGIELPAFAGRVIARNDATFTLPEVAMGLIPGAGGTVSIPRRIGRWRTLHLALTGQQLDSYTALRWGLVDVVEPADKESAAL